MARRAKVKRFTVSLDPADYAELKRIATSHKPPLSLQTAGAHYTEVVLENVFHAPVGRTVSKLKEHLTDIYRAFTGGVWGEFGLVDALRKKKEEVAPWLDDPRPSVKTFAAEYRRKIDGRIAAEQRAAEQEHELRKRSFEAGDDVD